MATLRDVAGRAGVSYTQASYVLNGRRLDCVSAERQTRIRQAMADLGYRPHAAARSTRRGRFGSIALLLGQNKGRSSLPSHLLESIHDALAERDLHLMIVRLPDQQLTNRAFVPRILRETASDGLLIDYTHDIPPRMIELIAAARIPSVWLNTRRDHDCVRPDDFQAGFEGTRRIIAAGHKRIAWADFSNGPALTDPHYSAADRMEGYLKAMHEAGLPPVVVRPKSGTGINGGQRRHAAARLLAQPDRPTAVFCYASTTAGPFYRAAFDLRLDIPNDLLVASCDDYVVPQLIPAAATMRVPHESIGHQAVEMLVKKINNPAQPLPARVVPFEWVQAEPSSIQPKLEEI